jgi:non-homologous end joining protein Ku
VPDDEIVRAYEWASDELVPVTEDDFAAAEGETLRRIEVVDFVPYDQIDPIHFERTYYLGPAQGAEKVYARCWRARWTSRGSRPSPASCSTARSTSARCGCATA